MSTRSANRTSGQKLDEMNLAEEEIVTAQAWLQRADQFLMSWANIYGWDGPLPMTRRVRRIIALAIACVKDANKLVEDQPDANELPTLTEAERAALAKAFDGEAPAAENEFSEWVFLFKPAELLSAQRLMEQLAERWQIKSHPAIMVKALELALREDG